MILIGLFLFNPFKKSSTQPAENRESQNAKIMDKQVDEVSDEDNGILQGNALDLLKLGKTLKCTYSTQDENTTTTGVSYISNNKMRGDFEIITENNEKINSHMVSDGEWMYSWTDTMDQGIKMKLEEVSAEDTTTPETNEDKSDTGLDALKNNVDYNCSKWVEDTTQFEIPTDVEFVDYSQMLKDLTGGDNSMCAACNYAQNEVDKAECLARLNCN